MCSDKIIDFRQSPRTNGLNPTLDWICALTDGVRYLAQGVGAGLNPTLDWICALTSMT